MPDSFLIRFTPPFLLEFADAFDATEPFLPLGWLPKTICLAGSLEGPAFLFVLFFEFSIMQGMLFIDLVNEIRKKNQLKNNTI